LDELLKAMELKLTAAETKKLEEGYMPVNVRGHV
jgi:hypothetical protein